MSANEDTVPEQMLHKLKEHRQRRQRTISENERILAGDVHKGKIESFCRSKGHGFIIPHGGGEKIFVHIQEIEDDYVPKEGDIVSYRLMATPPKNEKMQAVHVRLLHLNEHVTHEHWDDQLRQVDH